MTNTLIIVTGILFLVSCAKPQDITPPVPKGRDVQQIKEQAEASLIDDSIPLEPSPAVDPKTLDAPTLAIKKLDRDVEDYQLGKTLTPEQIEHNRQLKRKIITGTFDIAELCRQALDSNWDQITKNQQRLFVSLMTKLLETKALFSKEQLKGENKYYTIKYQNEVIDPDAPHAALVKTQMVIPKEAVTLGINYRLMPTANGWKIFDVIVDDASLLANYKVQFAKIIANEGFEELMNRLKRKLSQIEGANGKESITEQSQ